MLFLSTSKEMIKAPLIIEILPTKQSRKQKFVIELFLSFRAKREIRVSHEHRRLSLKRCEQSDTGCNRWVHNPTRASPYLYRTTLLVLT
uniref:Uncharacterized protein n=1 Tax=Candidatus Kentrum sp. TC TaxID=2126339 RepID=A0A450YIR4_9GAMM|nr:MAG: hypothetical protein BECKTC1821E_GA0114239_101141 [Candidatus Kentron sp. TC]VFK49877.1 MAG: hypothetical protein BECKTC1821D_GA0114238_10842 [Candidatus Kentron sp. TC]VFK59272.1 MAG: hypothetical protein BECKTC1821F_GA0114240_103111 [Candidatus Kentron sp. TC]